MSSTVVSHQTTVVNPDSVASASTSVRNCAASSIFDGFRMTASFLRWLGTASVSGGLSSAIERGVGS